MTDTQATYLMFGSLAIGILGLYWLIKKLKKSQVPMKVKEHRDSIEIVLFI